MIVVLLGAHRIMQETLMHEQRLSQFNEPQFYTNGRDIFSVLERLIAGAREEILIALYAFHDDASGERFITLLRNARERGVRVRLLFDNVEFLKIEGERLRNKLEAAGIEAMIFRPLSKWLPRHPLRAGCRNHARVFLFDRTVFGLGGIGIGDVYGDRDDVFVLCRVMNPAGVIGYFERLWRLATGYDANVSQENALDEALPGELKLLTSGPDTREQHLYRWLRSAFKNARERIIIAAPFFFPDQALLKKLLRAKKRGVNITVVTPLRTDKPRYDRFRALPMSRILRSGVRWYGTRKYFHSKFCIVDDLWTCGSSNIDIISTQRNYDLNICGRGGKALGVLEGALQHLKNDAEDVTKKPEPLWMRPVVFLFYRIAEFFFKLT